MSYTPSYGESVNTLNNFDTVHNYGSAADELENVGTLPHIEVHTHTIHVPENSNVNPLR